MIRKASRIHGKLLVGCMLFLFLAASGRLCAQDKAKNDEIDAKYKGQNAVYTNITEKLVIAMGENDTELVAHSYTTKEKLFLTENSLTEDNYDYCFHSSFHELTDINSVAYLPTGNTYKKVESFNFGEGRPRDYVFYDDNRIVEAIYSGLSKGAVTKTTYAIEHTDIHMLPMFFLQENIPIVHATFQIEAPDYVNISFVLKGENTEWFKQAKEEKNGITTYTFTADDVPAAKDYDNVPGIRYYTPHIIPFITTYQLPDNAKVVKLLSNPDDLYKYNYKFVNGINYRINADIANTVKSLTENDNTDKQKAAHIYNWVQKNMHYVAFEKGLEGFVPREADTVFKRKYGDCKDMSSITVAMLRQAGLKAYFTTIGTTDLPYTHEETPIPQIYNHMICALKLNGGWVFLDGTDPALPFGANRPDIQGKEACIAIDAQTHEIVKIPVEPQTRSTTYDATVLHLNGANVEGATDISYEGYPAWGIGEMLEMYRTKDEQNKAIKKLTGRGSNKYLVQKYNVNATHDGEKGLELHADFTIGDYAVASDKLLFVNLNLKHTYENFRVNDPTRKVAFYHDYKNMVTEVVTLDIPEGYRLRALPKDASGTLSGVWSYKITYTTDAKNHAVAHKVILTKQYELNALMVATDEFGANNKLVDQLMAADKETVTLEKIKGRIN